MYTNELKRQQTGTAVPPSPTQGAPSGTPPSGFSQFPFPFPSGQPPPPPPSGFPPPAGFPPPPSTSSAGTTAVAAIVGGVVGGIAFIIVLLVFLFFYLRSRRRTQQRRTSPDLPLQNNWLSINQRGTWLKERDSVLAVKSQEDEDDRAVGRNEKDNRLPRSIINGDDLSRASFFVAPFPVPVPTGPLASIQEMTAVPSAYNPKAETPFYTSPALPMSSGHFEQSSDLYHSTGSSPPGPDQTDWSRSDTVFSQVGSDPTNQDSSVSNRRQSLNLPDETADGVQFGKAF
ncbi:Concanavalin A-like lectin/glucanase, subgroup [Phaffia rhodozyma]|uniref:Concanavalin A-like lectin/glucanase, subgroup n=1 Tax=Phaffia rhodozyma TaxID=264483 RepID=A0A0F7SJ02_PHARH|nr:Concanavalin A-like lectin/glucanase, subgroup [Phaffia rhodozyma]